MAMRFARMFVLLVVAVSTIGVFSTFAEDVLATIDVPLATYFARIQPNPTYQIINESSIWFAEQNVVGTEYEGLPIITRQSTTAGGFGGPDNFMDLPAGDLTSDEMSNIYRYGNTIAALKLNGAQVIEWLEACGRNFSQIDPTSTEDQYLLDYEFDPHHLDHFYGISYMYDATQPAGSRVALATYQGVPLTEDMEFLVISDNYRAGGGANLPNAQPENIVLEWEYTYPELVVDYLNHLGGVAPEWVPNWSILPVETAGRILLKTGGEWGVPVLDYMKAAAAQDIEPVGHIEFIGTDDVWGLFVVDLMGVTTPLR